MKIYTKTGDRGETGLYGGVRVSKTDPVIEALGAIDELNAYLGTIDFDFEETQTDLMEIAAQIAGFKSSKSLKVEKLEEKIDQMQKGLPELKNFILPKGQIHYARTICRRTERKVVSLNSKLKIPNSKQILEYLNRLSDYLFVLARWVNHKNKVTERIWS